MDWKSSLDALRSSLPEGEAIPEPAPAESGEKQQGRLDIEYDRKGRKGKPATIISGFTLSDEAVAEVARQLKQKLAVGGSSRGGEILLQGDKRREAAALLTSLGYKNRII